MDRGPGRPQRVGEPLGRAHQLLGIGKLAERDDDPFAPRPGAGQRMGAEIVEHLRIDRLGRAAKRELAQGRQIGFGEEMPERPRRFVGNVDLALLQPLDQLVGRDIHHLDLGIFEDAVRHCLAHPHLGEGGDDVVEAFEMLDVDGGIDMDAGGEQLLDVLVALGVAAAGDVGMGELVDQDEPRPALEDGVDVHLGDGATPIVGFAAGDDLLVADQRLGLGAAVGLHHPDHRIDAGAAAGGAFGEHLVCLADPRRGAEEHLQTAAGLAGGLAQQGVWRRAAVGHGALFAPIASSCRLSSSTFTCGSPSRPKVG